MLAHLKTKWRIVLIQNLKNEELYWFSIWKIKRSVAEIQVFVMACHPFGCRVVQRVLEHCTQQQVLNCFQAKLSCFLKMSNKSWFINRVDSVKPFKESVYSVQTSGLLEELLGSTDQLLQVCGRTFQRIYILFVFNIYICAFLGSIRKLCDSAHSRQRKTGTQVQDR